MQPFQQWFVELFSMLNDILVGVAAVIGIVGLWKWRAELVGKAKFDLARQILSLSLQYSDCYKDARVAGTFASESAERIRPEGETLVETTKRNEFFARANRLNKLAEIIQKLQALNWEAEAILSEEDARLTQPLEESYKKLFIAVNTYEHDTALREIIYGSPNDELSKSVEAAVNEIKKKLRKYVV